jgi:hypothetical protein
MWGESVGDRSRLRMRGRCLLLLDGMRVSLTPRYMKIVTDEMVMTDVSFEPRPANYTLLRMHTLPPTGGDTLFASAYSHYDSLSPHLAKFLEGMTATHHAEMFRTQAARHGFKLRTAARGAPENCGDGFRSSHPIVRTNPVTGLKGLFVNVTFTRSVQQLPLPLPAGTDEFGGCIVESMNSTTTNQKRCSNISSLSKLNLTVRLPPLPSSLSLT